MDFFENILAVKYEKQLRKVVLEGLTGREVEIKSDDTISYEGEDDWQWEVPTPTGACLEN